jgi:hypothetical protein
MMAIAFLFVGMLGDCFKSRQRLEAEILVLRHQLNVLQQRAPRRVHLHWAVCKRGTLTIAGRFPALALAAPCSRARMYQEG